MNKGLLLPNNINYERAILSLLIYPSTTRDERGEVFDSLSEDDFYQERHRFIFKACKRLYEQKAPVDLVSATEAVEHKIEGAGSFISEIVDTLPASDISHYVSKLRNCTTARKALILSSKFIEELRISMVDGNVNELLDAHQRDILQLNSTGTIHRFTDIQKLSVDAYSRYRDLSAGHALQAIPTGYYGLDRLIHLRGSKLVIIAARPSVGKTAFAGNIIRNLAVEGYKCALFEMEMDKEDIIDRWISAETEINLVKLSHGSSIRAEEWPKILKASEAISKWPVLIDDQGGLKSSDLRRRIRLAKKEGCEIVFIDQLSQIRGDGVSEYERNTGITQELSKLKKELHIPIVLLCQVNRKVEDSQSKKPRLSMLKTTGALEEEADIVLLLDRPFTYTGKSEDKDKAIVDVAKQRGGPTGSIELEWIGRTVTFKNKVV